MLKGFIIYGNNMSKIFFCASTASHILNFHLPYLRALKLQKNEVWIAINAEDVIPYAHKVLAFPFSKKYLSVYNWIALWQIRKLLLQEQFDEIITHTALASAIVRLAVLLLPACKRPRVCYISHGFLFHETQRIKKWIYLIPEKICACITNVLMVMNAEDFEIAKRHHIYKEKLVFIDGIGFDASKRKYISSEDRKKTRASMTFREQDVLFIYAAEFSKRKNHRLLIEAFSKIAQEYPQAHLLFAGDGNLFTKSKLLVNKLHLQDQIHFLGYVKEMDNLYPICDVAVSSSRIEGLPFNVMEAMAYGLSVLLSNTKGHWDLVDGNPEFLFDSAKSLEEKMKRLISACPITMNWSKMLERRSLKEVMPTVMDHYTKW